jgi:diguanylate cyclase (GGDEF)-like protein
LMLPGTHPIEEKTIALTGFIMHKYYCENDVESIISLLDRDVVWLGTAENEYAAGLETVAGISRRFAGQVPKCDISGEEYSVLPLGPDACLCAGRMWIATAPSTGISLRVHQRVTTVFRQTEQDLRCCHIHISNPYEEMVDDDVGFPVKLARQSYQYLQEQIEAQKRQIAAQTATLQRMSFEDALTGVYNRNKFNQVVDSREPIPHLGVACFDLNGLKETNDHLGHGAGDALLRRAAEQLQQHFSGRVYRTGGDEFVVVEGVLDQAAFCAAVEAVQAGMAAHGISCSVGVCWRDEACCPKEQLEEADQLMYQAKRRFYSLKQNDRRNRR